MKILIVGISVRAMAESAIHSSYSVIAVDAFGDRDLKALAEAYSLNHDFHTRYSAGALYKAGRRLDCDAVAYTSNLENHPEILERFAEGQRIIGNSPQVIESVRSWPVLFSKLRSAGFSVPETIFTGEDRLIDPDRRWLVKPVLSGGGQGIAFLDPGIQRSSKKANECGIPGFMLQEYIAGKPCSASFVANGDECVVLGITLQLIGEDEFGSRDFRYCGNILPLPEMLNPETGRIILEQLYRLSKFVTQEYGLTGVNGIDFILSGDRVHLTEINPRYSASMELIEQAYKLPVFHLHMRAVLHGELPAFNLEAKLKSSEFFGKAILFAERDSITPDTEDRHAKGIRDVPTTGEMVRKSSPICTILANRQTYRETFAQLIRKAKVLKEEIYDQAEFNPDYRTFYPTRHRNLDWKRIPRISGSH
jgi:predicted ATP-grasp superfamily ATP-dependent carboligase